MNASAVSARNVVMRFGTFTAVDDVSFEVAPGEVFGFLGANGAGKTTTIRILCGLLVPTGGTVTVGGVDLAADPQAVKRLTGYMSQRFTMYNDMTVAENLAFKGALFKIPPADLQRRTAELLAFIGFDHPVSTLVRDLPGGLKQQVSLAGAILHDPAVVFLDEPTAGVAPAARTRFWALIQRLRASGKTVFVTTHYMDEAEQCGRIALMRAGRIIALDSPAGLKTHAFPGLLLELEAAAGAPPGWETTVSAAPGAGRLAPYGMRWHLAMRREDDWKTLEPRLPAGVTARRITPTLEDVFIELSEAAPG